MLTIDHINDDGAHDRKINKVGGGVIFYGRLIRLGFPEGFQVLCFNHQWKKRMLGLRNELTKGAIA